MPPSQRLRTPFRRHTAFFYATPGTRRAERLLASFHAYTTAARKGDEHASDLAIDGVVVRVFEAVKLYGVHRFTAKVVGAWPSSSELPEGWSLMEMPGGPIAVDPISGTEVFRDGSTVYMANVDAGPPGEGQSMDDLLSVTSAPIEAVRAVCDAEHTGGPHAA